MSNNYDSTNRASPFLLISEMRFTYDTATLAPFLQFTEQPALADDGGKLHTLAAPTQARPGVAIDVTDQTPIQVYDPKTGQAIPGAMTTRAQVFAQVYSVAHGARLAADAAAAAPAAPVAP